MLIESCLIHYNNFLVFRDPECPRAHVWYESNIYCFFCPWRVLSFYSAVLVQVISIPEFSRGKSKTFQGLKPHRFVAPIRQFSIRSDLRYVPILGMFLFYKLSSLLRFWGQQLSVQVDLEQKASVFFRGNFFGGNFSRENVSRENFSRGNFSGGN